MEVQSSCKGFSNLRFRQRFWELSGPLKCYRRFSDEALVKRLDSIRSFFFGPWHPLNQRWIGRFQDGKHHGCKQATWLYSMMSCMDSCTLCFAHSCQNWFSCWLILGRRTMRTRKMTCPTMSLTTRLFHSCKVISMRSLYNLMHSVDYIIQWR